MEKADKIQLLNLTDNGSELCSKLMAKRPTFRRAPDDFKKGRVAPWPKEKPPQTDVAARVTYFGSGEHKNYPSSTGQWTLVRCDKTKCDKFDERDWSKLEVLLRMAILAPTVSKEFRGDFPARIWAFINDVLHEAKLSNSRQGQYHGFPLQYKEQYPHDPDGLLSKAPRVTIPTH